MGDSRVKVPPGVDYQQMDGPGAYYPLVDSQLWASRQPASPLAYSPLPDSQLVASQLVASLLALSNYHASRITHCGHATCNWYASC